MTAAAEKRDVLRGAKHLVVDVGDDRQLVLSDDIDFASLLSEHVGYAIDSSDDTPSDTQPDHRPLARLLQTLHEFGRMVLSVE